jgi:hypothetical protein
VTIPTEGTLPALQAQWPYAPNYINANGWRMHYVDEGEGDEKRRKERRCARADIGEYFGRFSGCSLLADCRYRVVTYEACHPVPLQIPEDR